jgi:alkanesulfonate monooxygenase SsuD/methylene tetrahydromethanopterin reductase-like flavin-dependent oxidoreductase (luciferase family)
MEGGKGTSVDIVGTPEPVANCMAEVMEEVGSDGFRLKHPFNQPTLRDTPREF